MRRFFRRIATAVRLVLLIAGLATIVLWCRSYFAWDQVTRTDRVLTDSRRYVVSSVRSEKGELTFVREECIRLEYKGESSAAKTRRNNKRFYYHTSSRED